MMRMGTGVKLLIAVVALAIALGLMATSVTADAGAPPPYTGVKNPFPWDDTGVQAQGKKPYEKSCAGCHGAQGKSLPTANFAAPGYSGKLEAEPDYYFWLLSEGKMKSGMPAYKSSVPDNERWQMLTYVWTMSKPAGQAPAPVVSAGGSQVSGLSLTIGERTASLSGLVLTALARGPAGEPMGGEPVKFFLKKDFFVAGWMEIGEAVTGKDGQAVLEYFPSEDGAIQVAARLGEVEATGNWTVKARSRGYQAEAGLRLPTLAPPIPGGAQVAIEPLEVGRAPAGGLRLGSANLSWVLIFVAVVVFIWSTYFRVFRQVMLISGMGRGEGLSVRVVPLAAMLFVLAMGTILAVVILRGPPSHLHLLP